MQRRPSCRRVPAVEVRLAVEVQTHVNRDLGIVSR
jgi:hypothetical protein